MPRITKREAERRFGREFEIRRWTAIGERYGADGWSDTQPLFTFWGPVDKVEARKLAEWYRDGRGAMIDGTERIAQINPS